VRTTKLVMGTVWCGKIEVGPAMVRGGWRLSEAVGDGLWCTGSCCERPRRWRGDGGADGGDGGVRGGRR
jgi:hypothetical protein